MPTRPKPLTPDEHAKRARNEIFELTNGWAVNLKDQCTGSEALIRREDRKYVCPIEDRPWAATSADYVVVPTAGWSIPQVSKFLALSFESSRLYAIDRTILFPPAIKAVLAALESRAESLDMGPAELVSKTTGQAITMRQGAAMFVEQAAETIWSAYRRDQGPQMTLAALVEAATAAAPQ